MKGERAKFEAFTQHTPTRFMPLGAYSYSQSDSKYIKYIGRYCSIGKDLTVMGDAHPINWVSTNPIFYNSQRYETFSKEKHHVNFPEYHISSDEISIGNDVWIADRVTLKGGVRIGDGAVIGFGSIVTKDVPPYAIVAGSPAKIIKYRFPEGMIKDFIEMRWWNYGAADITTMPTSDPKDFIRQFYAKSKNWNVMPEKRLKAEVFLSSCS